MPDQELRFSGSVPENYDRLMVPLIFRPYAEELTRRVKAIGPHKVLETAAGTGVVTKAIHDALPDAKIIATDLNPPMLEVAGQRVRSERVRFVQADARDLPFEDGSFDLVLCQFGSMFFPDKIRAHSEARRVLREGGRYLLAIWDRIERNQISNAAQEALVDYFPQDPPMFMREGPFGYHDTSRIESDLRDAGFKSVEIETIERRSRCPSAHDAAMAFFYGTPMGVEVEEKAAGSSERVFASVERALRRIEGPGGLDAPMAAHIVTASR